MLNKKSPWGNVEEATQIIDGIWKVKTPGHGGIYLEPFRNNKVPVYMRNKCGWYEKDIEAVKVLIFYHRQFRHVLNIDIEATKARFQKYFPGAYETYYGERCSSN